MDENRLARATALAGSDATPYRDYRYLLERKDIDAVLIATPDHWHTKISIDAMLAGKDVYCEKPLTHSVHELRVAVQVAHEQKVATQMGTQIHAGGNYRRAVELIQSGAIGDVTEVHVWVGKGWGEAAQAGSLIGQKLVTPTIVPVTSDVWALVEKT